jgi:hypothetical protein
MKKLSALFFKPEGLLPLSRLPLPLVPSPRGPKAGSAQADSHRALILATGLYLSRVVQETDSVRGTAAAPRPYLASWERLAPRPP